MTVQLALLVLFALASGWYWSANRTARRQLVERDNAISRLMEENRLLRRGPGPKAAR